MEKEHLEIILEQIDSKFSIVVEGYGILRREMHDIKDELKQDIALLDFKVETVKNHLSGRIDKLETKVDGIAADLKAHRVDTEAHGSIYRIKEGPA